MILHTYIGPVIKRGYSLKRIKPKYSAKSSIHHKKTIKKREPDYDTLIEGFMIQKYMALASMDYMDEECDALILREEQLKKDLKATQYSLPGRRRSLYINKSDNIKNINTNSTNYNGSSISASPNLFTKARKHSSLNDDDRLMHSIGSRITPQLSDLSKQSQDYFSNQFHTGRKYSSCKKAGNILRVEGFDYSKYSSSREIYDSSVESIALQSDGSLIKIDSERKDSLNNNLMKNSCNVPVRKGRSLSKFYSQYKLLGLKEESGNK